MPSDYPISGIKRSYRHTPETRTIVMPILIGLVLAGMGVFYFQTRPGGPEETEDSSSETFSETAGMDIPTTLTGSEEESLVRAMPIASEAPAKPSATSERAAGPPSGSDGFTAWMSPLALDTYIRQQNGGHDDDFWERGHWITAVEGRWQSGEHQFRIAYEEIPDMDSLQWQYRANQSFEQFTGQIEELARRGYRLVQSQFFEHPEEGLRYQGVWRRRVGPTHVADSETGSSSPAEEAPAEAQ